MYSLSINPSHRLAIAHLFPGIRLPAPRNTTDVCTCRKAHLFLAYLLVQFKHLSSSFNRIHLRPLYSDTRIPPYLTRLTTKEKGNSLQWQIEHVPHFEQRNADSNGDNQSGVQLNVFVDDLKAAQTIGIRFHAHSVQRSRTARGRKTIAGDFVIAIAMEIHRTIDSAAGELDQRDISPIFRQQNQSTCLCTISRSCSNLWGVV